METTDVSKLTNIMHRAGKIARIAIIHGLQFRIETTVALLNLGTVVTGFILQILVLRFSGASRDADAYFATSAIPQMALSIAVHVVTGTLLPQLARTDDRTRAVTVWALLAIIMGCGLPVAITAYCLAPRWTFLIFPGFANAAVPASISLAGLAVLATPFAVATCVLTANLYAQRRFLASESISLVTGVTLALAAAAFVPSNGIVVLGWLVLGRFMAQTFLLSLFLPLRGLRHAHPALGVVLRRARPLFLGALYFKSDLIVDRFLLSFAPSGALSIVAFGQSIFSAASGVLGQSLANTASPTLSIAHNARDEHKFRSVLGRHLGIIAVASLVLLVASVVLVPPVAALLTTHAVSRGEVNLRWVLLLLGGVPLGSCIGGLLASAFYAMGDTRTPTLMAAITFTIFLIAKVFVFTNFGMYAFCGLTSIYYIVNTSILALLLRRKLRTEFPT